MEERQAELRKEQQTFPTNTSEYDGDPNKPLIIEVESHITSPNGGSQRTSVRRWAVRLLKGLLWAMVWALTIEIGFGSIYIIISLLGFVYFNTRTRKEKDSGPSAYSVFNPGCERIEGTFTAEQFEREIGIAYK